MFYTYILYSNSIDKFYIGASENPQERLKKHNAKNNGFTNQTDDWKIVFLKSFDTKTDALAFEKQIKSWKSRLKIQKMIASAGSEHPDAQQSGGSGFVPTAYASEVNNPIK